MNQFFKFFTIMFVVLCVATSCKKDDITSKNIKSKLVQSSISGVNGPTVGAVNQEITFSVVWQNEAGTSKFDHLKDSTSGSTKLIRMFALTNVPDTTLSSAKGSNTVSYKFKAATAGTYYLKFYNSDNSERTAIVDTLTIK